MPDPTQNALNPLWPRLLMLRRFAAHERGVAASGTFSSDERTRNAEFLELLATAAESGKLVVLDQPFTPADVTLLEEAADFHESLTYYSFPDEAKKFRSLASRIRSLLPPEKP